ncbi:hypothetical protein HK100_006730 [Physocladia obscura]|uniref:CAP-Gly domain-containing protein n=1 Tax=Physocladia obscura TaxID=109957 RepID=A0AAD5T529_9FUNG|nr:hypothetical protein HK100_006730 [Physocladia obscura]
MGSNLDLVGTRIAVDGRRGTVRYVGSVFGQTGCWLGIEWDDPAHGRHSGEGLFTVNLPGSASFVRATSAKLVRPRPFLAALRDRYISSSNSDLAASLTARDVATAALALHNSVNNSATAETTDYSAQRSSGLGMRRPGEEVAVEMVGWEKVRSLLTNLASLTILGLAECAIGWVEEQELEGGNAAESKDVMADQAPGTIRATCPLVEDLDLSRNLFASWQAVARIACQLDHLASLRLNNNRLSLLPDHSLLTPAFNSLKILALISTLMPWDEMEALAPHMPNLTALHFGLNKLASFGKKYTTIEYSADFGSNAQTYSPLFPNLETLNVEDNQLTSWSELTNFVKQNTPSLVILNVGNNVITSISPAKDDEFRHLKFLNVSKNKINTYMSIHAMNSFSKLVDIRVKDNPVFDLQPPTTVSSFGGSAASADGVVLSHCSTADETISRLSKATRINGGVVSERDRSDAEMYYLNKVATWIYYLRATATAAISAVAKSTSDNNASSGVNHLESKIDALVTEFHPRYHELVRIYGVPQVTPTSITSNALKDRLISLVFCLAQEDSEAAATVTIVKRVEKKVPLSMALRALRALVSRVLGVRGGVLKIRGMCEGGARVVELEEETRDIGYYDFVAGDEVHVFVR